MLWYGCFAFVIDQLCLLLSYFISFVIFNDMAALLKCLHSYVSTEIRLIVAIYGSNSSDDDDNVGSNLTRFGSTSCLLQTFGIHNMCRR
jgi:hypothetical protein